MLTSEILLKIFIVLAVGIIIISSVARLTIAMAISKKHALLLLCLRIVAISLTIYFLWKIFWGYEREESDDTDKKAKTLLVLSDMSKSMELPGDKHSTRHEITREIEKKIQKRFDETPGVTYNQIYFAENMVDDSGLKQLRNEKTAIHRAVQKAQDRLKSDAILVLSDGIQNSGVNRHTLSTKKTFSTPTYAICTADQTGFDIVVSHIECEKENPVLVRSKVILNGMDKGGVTVQLSVDKKVVRTISSEIEAEKTFSFRLPKLEDGWHEYTISASGDSGEELTTVNNALSGVFKVSSESRNKILFIVDTPRRENITVARFLRRKYPEDIIMCNATPEALSQVNTSKVRMVVIGDVSMKKIPTAIINEFTSANNFTTLLLAGKNSASWAKFDSSIFSGVKRKTFAVKNGNQPRISIKELPADIKQWPFKKAKSALYYHPELTKDAVTLYQLKSSTKHVPLVMADSLEKPRFAVVLSDATWKWMVNPSLSTRKDYTKFWDMLTNTLLKEEKSSKPLRLTVDGTGENNNVKLKVTSQSPLTDCIVQAKSEAGERKYSISNQTKEKDISISQQDTVVWFQAIADIDRKSVESDRVPYITHSDKSEFNNTIADASIFNQYLTEKGLELSQVSNADELIDHIINELLQGRNDREIRHRSPLREFLIVLIILFLIFVEWFIERQLMQES